MNAKHGDVYLEVRGIGPFLRGFCGGSREVPPRPKRPEWRGELSLCGGTRGISLYSYVRERRKENQSRAE